MAMDKEKLLAYFQAHYLSRQEVLFKLPLNVSIDSFWPELLNRRKAMAQVLPLYNAAGMPYWYVLTERMVRASERLCEEAIRQDSFFDPYRAGMTSAMTEEMFFTSFVEGAQIPLQEAMDFLQRGTEPESIQEQMIWNNRRAWTEMTAALFRPLDENFVRTLAFMLTEEMDNCAEDYRQTDLHPIAAMNNEPYEVPPAYILAERMGGYYDFLQTPDVHPLIKAAVAQAYLLVTRPFPEGNERLSRMISSAVLLRSGYDFFRDISISSVIARESYRYYKSMCEIIRTENGGDLTYFIQYYLELLVRALDARNERQRKREQEAREREQEVLQQERELARTPLTSTVLPCDEGGSWEKIGSMADTIRMADVARMADADDIAGRPLPKFPSAAEGEPAGAEDINISKEIPFVNSQGPLLDPETYLEAISKIKHSQYSNIGDLSKKVRLMMNAGLLSFDAAQWAEVTGTRQKAAEYECRYLFEKGWMTRTKEKSRFIYTLKVRWDDDYPGNSCERNEAGDNAADDNGAVDYSAEEHVAGENAVENNVVGDDAANTNAALDNAARDNAVGENVAGDDVAVNDSVERQGGGESPPKGGYSPIIGNLSLKLLQMERSHSTNVRSIASAIRTMQARGMRCFSRDDIMGLSGMSVIKARDACDYLLAQKIVVNISPRKKQALYAFADSQEAADYLAESSSAAGEDDSAPVSAALISRIREIASTGYSDRDRQFCNILLSFIETGVYSFSAEDVLEKYPMAKGTFTNSIRTAINQGFIRRESVRDEKGQAIYSFARGPLQDIRSEGLTNGQRQILTMLYTAFRDDCFNTHEAASVCRLTNSGFTFHAENFTERGIMAIEKKQERINYYTLVANPQKHPECFVFEKAPPRGQSSGSSLSSPIPYAAASA